MFFTAEKHELFSRLSGLRNVIIRNKAVIFQTRTICFHARHILYTVTLLEVGFANPAKNNLATVFWLLEDFPGMLTEQRMRGSQLGHKVPGLVFSLR